MEYNTIENFLPQSMQDYIEYYMLNTVYGLMDEGSGQQDDFDKNNKLFNKTNSFLQVKNKITKYDNSKYKPYFYLLNKDMN